MYRPRRRTSAAARVALERPGAEPVSTPAKEDEAFRQPAGAIHGRQHSRTTQDLRRPARALLARSLRSVEEVQRARAEALHPHRSQGRGKSTLDRDRAGRWHEGYWAR